MSWIEAAALSLTLTVPAGSANQPQIVETRAIRLTQTVTLREVPKEAGRVRLWVPIPSDTAWQRVLDRKVESAPAGWQLVRQSEGRGDFLYFDLAKPPAGDLAVVVSCTVEREGVHFPVSTAGSDGTVQPGLFEEYLNAKAPLMEADERVQALADRICGDERDPATQGMLLLRAVASTADHYSKDASKPKCGRGAASDCLDHGGGCCTDLHSLFIAMARSRDVPARLQFGYRALDAKAGQSFDPTYRCWVEFFVPGTGWVPNDIVASDGADQSNPRLWGSLSATRVWLWEGRSFELTPPAAAGPVHTMICGWAEIDGKPVDPLPAADGTPSRLGRTIKFEVLHSDRDPNAPKLPE